MTVASPCPLLELFMLCFPPQMQIYLYNSDDFDSLGAAIKERRIISAMAVFFEVRRHPPWRFETGGAPAHAGRPSAGCSGTSVRASVLHTHPPLLFLISWRRSRTAGRWRGRSDPLRALI